MQRALGAKEILLQKKNWHSLLFIMYVGYKFPDECIFKFRIINRNRCMNEEEKEKEES